MQDACSGTSSTGKDAARSAAATDASKAFTSYVDSIFNSLTNENESKLVRYEEKGTLSGVNGYLYGNFSWGGNEDQTSESSSVVINMFTEILSDDITDYEYRVEYGEADKNASFAVALAPAPTGTFQLNFALDDTVPAGYEGAVFEIKNANGDVLAEGTDYTLEKSPYSLEDITKGVLKWGISIYKFSGIKAGSYTFKQVSTANGYKIDTNEYSFTVAREDGKVSGDFCDTSAINTSDPCIWNADKSINILVTKIKLYLFMNESFTLSFNVKDQNGEPVEGAEFMMIERDALVTLVGQLAKLGVDNIGNIDINNIIETIGGLDFSNIDVGTVLEILKAVVTLLPELPEGTILTVPAILMASSNEEGIVKFNNSSNILNVLGTIADIMAGIDGEVDAEQLAETIKNLVGSAVPEEYLDTLVALARYMNVLDVHTGIPSAYYVLLQTSAPEGYERNATTYTIKVSTDGTATTNAGILIPVIADAIKERFGYDIYDLLVDEEEFANASAEIKEIFGNFDDYMNLVVDAIEEVLGDNTVLGVSKEKLEQFKETVNDSYDNYDDFSAGVGEALKQLNSSIKDDFTEDWTYTNNRYFLDVDVTAEDCGNNAIDFTVTDADGAQWDIVDGVATLPYGTYTFAPAEELDEKYILTEDSSAFELVIDDHNATYAVAYTYHVKEITGAYEPDCTNEGYTGNVVCAYCDYVFDEGSTIDALGHDEIDLIGYEPTCTQTGLTDGKYCTRCETTTVEQETIPANGHTKVEFGEKETTCFEDGYIAGIMCEVCGEVLVEPEINESKGHIGITFDELTYTPATCTEWGKDFDIICTMCETTLYTGDPIEPLGHDYAVEVTAPTCTEQGYTTYTCERVIEYYDFANEEMKVIECGDVQVDDYVNANGHTEVIDEAVAPNCTETGLTEGKHCSVCNEVLVAQETVDALGHDYDAVVTDPNCTEEGYTTYTCSVCGDSYVADYTDALGHTEVIDKAVAPTCTETGLTEGKHCSVCNEVLVAQVTVDANGHTEVVDEAVAPNCTETGLTEGKHCSVCNEVLVAQETVDANGHTEVIDEAVAPNCTETGLTEGKHCSVCNEVLVAQVTVDALGHDYDAAVTDPNCTEEGYTTYTCSVCGDSYVDDYVDALGHDFGEWVETDVPNCTSEGTATRYCSRCDAFETKTLDIRHEFTATIVEPKCTYKGYTLYKCENCGKTYIDDEVPATGHLDKDIDGVCDVCGEDFFSCLDTNDNFRCSMCDRYEEYKDAPILGLLYKLVHFFVHLGQSMHLYF